MMPHNFSKPWQLTTIAFSLATLLSTLQPLNAYAAGESELIAMPTGRLEADGTWRSDFSFVKPYPIFRTQATVLPWLQGGLGIVRIMGVSGFPSTLKSDPNYTQFIKNYGDYKDKTIFGRIKLSDESDTLPASALILQDPIGTGLFKSTAIAASKRFAIGSVPIDATLGYGTGRIKGLFGGVKVGVPSYVGLNLMLEKDATNYQKDLYAVETGLNQIHQPLTYGLEYKPPNAGWGVRLARRMGATELQVQYELDANQRDLAPKTEEYPRFRTPLPKPTAAQWLENPAYEAAMRSVLYSYGFQAVSITYNNTNTNTNTNNTDQQLTLTLAHPQQVYASAAVGEAIHIALKTSPIDTKSIVIHYLNGDTHLPVVDYTFTDLTALEQYLTGETLQAQLLPTVQLTDPIRQNDRTLADDVAHRNDAEQAAQAALSTALSQAYQAKQRTDQAEAAQLTSLSTAPLGGYRLQQLGLQPRPETAQWSHAQLGLAWHSGGEQAYRFNVAPKLSTYLNGPGGLQYALKVDAQGDAKLANNTYASVILSQTLTENVSKLGIGPSNSTYPNVRSRGAFYEVGKRPKLDLAVVNHFEHLGQNLYARINAGLYERAYAGVGGQVLYAPTDAAWAVDVSLDQVAQRHETEMFGFNGYRTLTALAALHYRLPMETNVTLRAGRFLAKDIGARMEFTRRFWGGIELGAWFTVTNAKDYGVGASNYRDKGLLISIPFDGLLPTYSRQKAQIALAPWTRDVGQMVNNPADLYSILAEDLRSKHVQGGLERLAGVADYDGHVPMGALGIDTAILPLIGQTFHDFKQGATQANWTEMLATGAVFTASAAVSDRWVNRGIARSTANASVQQRFKQLDDITTGLGVLGLGTSALWAYDGSQWERSRVALSSLQASSTAIMLATGLKYLTGRARPEAGLGAASFGAGSRSNSSFPSRHVAMATALVTPYALHYDAPILYVLPTITALARVGTRQHWFSDVAAGAALGYVLGNVFYTAHSSAAAVQHNPVLFNATKNSLTVIIPTK